MMQRLDDRLVRALPFPAKGYRITYDKDLKGFGVRVTAARLEPDGTKTAGAKSFILNYRARGRERRLTIGSFPDWDTTAARKHAKDLKRQVDAGEDPMAERHAERAAPTIAQLADRFEAEHLPKRRAGTQEFYRGILRCHIRPTIGSIKVAALTHADVEKLHTRIASATPYAANRTAAVLSKMMSLAVKWGLRPDNPVKGLERAAEHKRQRFLSPAEISRLGEALAQHPERASARAVQLLLLTGARRGEVLSATWPQFDLDAGVWVKPAATTKTNREHRVPLSGPALVLLRQMKAEADAENARRVRDGFAAVDFLFPGKPGQPLTAIKKSWHSVTRTAGLEGFRIHDLRHTYASVLASEGLSLPIIGALLGHTQASTTHRYSHLLDDPLRQATEAAGAIISGKPVATVLPLRRKA
jgi:integrase